MPNTPSNAQYEAIHDLTLANPSDPSKPRKVKAREVFRATPEELVDLVKDADYRERS